MFTPEPSSNLVAKQEAANRVSDMARGNFIFAYHPDEWQVNVKNELVPVIVHLSKEPGNGPVASSGDFTDAEVHYRKRGYELIPHDILGDVDYVAPYRNTKGRLVHRTIFQEAYNTPSGETKWQMDEEAFSAFIRLLRERGTIKPPKPNIVAGMIKIRQELLKNKRMPAANDEEKIARYNDACANARAQIAMLEAEYEKCCEVHGRPAAIGRSLVLKRLREGQARNEAGKAARAEVLDRVRPPEPDEPARGKGGATKGATKAGKGAKAAPKAAEPKPPTEARYAGDEDLPVDEED